MKTELILLTKPAKFVYWTAMVGSVSESAGHKRKPFSATAQICSCVSQEASSFVRSE